MQGAGSQTCAAGFLRAFGVAPSFVARAPGRINLLGEHTDYNGLPVLPMAIDRCVWIAGKARSDRRIHLVNADPRFPRRDFEIGRAIPSGPAGDWANYVKAAAQGLVVHAEEQGGPRLSGGGDFFVSGDVPAGAGLSSSSALVVASALAILAANRATLPFPVLAELLPIAERYVGTLSGGMDQAASLLSRQGEALRIDFFPLRTRPVPLPEGYRFVVCHSLVEAEKAGAAKRAYNLRVIECRLACRVLEQVLEDPIPRPLRLLGDLVSLFPDRPLVDFLPPLERRLADRPLSLGEIAAILGVDGNSLRQDCSVPPEVGDSFALLRRVRHVLREAMRVDRAERLLREGDAGGFAALMDASHASCRDDYAISCPELETLVGLAKQAGALGARLTGAGFGGCTVNLVAEDRVSDFVAALDRAFYRNRRGPEASLADLRFVFSAQAGASVLRLDESSAPRGHE